MQLIEIVLLVLLSGVPYYLLLRRFISYDKIFVISTLFLLAGLFVKFQTELQCSWVCITISIFSVLITFYIALKTTNLYRLSYHFLFMNSPVFLLIDIKYSIYYAVALIITLVGLFFIGKYYKRNYGSANFANISGLAIATPFVGFVLRIYLISLALYPPFPNSVFLFNSFVKDETSYMWYVVLAVVIFSNFLISMRILTNTVFGKPNKIIFYNDIKGKERIAHFIIVILLTIWGLNGLMEVLK